MKNYIKKISEVVMDKKIFFITILCGVFLLLFTSSYFVITTNFKGTSAASTYQCPPNTSAMKIVAGDSAGQYVCCPSGTLSVSKESDGNYYCQN